MATATRPLPLRSPVEDPRSARQSMRDPGDATTGELHLGALRAEPRRHRPGRGARPTFTRRGRPYGKHVAAPPLWPRVLAVAVAVPAVVIITIVVTLPLGERHTLDLGVPDGVIAIGPGLAGQAGIPEPGTPGTSGTTPAAALGSPQPSPTTVPAPPYGAGPAVMVGSTLVPQATPSSSQGTPSSSQPAPTRTKPGRGHGAGVEGGPPPKTTTSTTTTTTTPPPTTSAPPPTDPGPTPEAGSDTDTDTATVPVPEEQPWPNSESQPATP